MKLDLKARAQNRTRRATKRAETLANKSRGSGSEAEEAVAMGFEQSHSPLTSHHTLSSTDSPTTRSSHRHMSPYYYYRSYPVLYHIHH